MKSGRLLAAFALGVIWATLLNIACWTNYLGWTYTEWVVSKQKEMEFATSYGWFWGFGVLTTILIVLSVVAFWDED
jgi:hypothetical protein